MAQYIDKSVLVAEIERLMSIYNDDENIYHVAKYNILVDILSFLDTLETKEVDLEKEVKDYIYTLPHSRTGFPVGWKCSWGEEEVIKIVKHFLEIK